MASGGLGVSESSSIATQRALELYKYFTPPSSSFATSKLSSANTILAAHAQLIAWRLDSRRAMVSLIDRDTQYFVAESSKTLNLEDNSQYDDPRDVLWAGCVSVPKAGKLCEHTIQALPKSSGRRPYFEVVDLEKDERFNTLPFVSGPPNFRYYCGMPLRTKNGINIGSIFALDDKVRAPVDEAQVSFLGTMADNCMMHLETLRERGDLKRIKSMNMCLAAFVDRENRVRRKRRRSRQSLSRPLYQTVSTSGNSIPEIESSAAKAVEMLDARHHSEHPDDSSQYSSETSRDAHAPEADDQLSTVQLATDLLLKSLCLDPPSGIIVFDSGTSLTHLTQSRSSGEDSSDDAETTMEKLSRTSVGRPTRVSYKSWPGSLKGQETGQCGAELSPPSDILACSNEFPSGSDGSPSPSPSYRPLSQLEVAKLIKKYPRGALIHLEEDEIGPSNSSGDEAGSKNAYQMPKTRNIASTKAEQSMLRDHFTGSRQLILVPVWNPNWSRYSLVVAYNTSPYRNFKRSPDLLQCIAFSHCIATELTRIAILSADQQKSDFIGSVSHELRSPLHGILASCEFLENSDLSSFQKSLVHTADSCARTLLDTINMVLDYSKVNAFERSMAKAKRSRQQSISSTAHLQPALNIYGDVDLAAIMEEVVEGVTTGQVFKDRLADVDVIDINPDYSGVDDLSKQKADFAESRDVEIIVDIPPRNWMFHTQPGAFRRVVMNVFGNAIKFTNHGYIHVMLDAGLSSKTGEEKDETQTVTIRITDTGRGISPEYMRTKLFTPFAQESSIAPGTGLGLSLVRSIVSMLNGSINIESTVGKGTDVTIKFPMVVSSPTGSITPASTPPSAGSLERTKDESIKLVQQRAKGRTAFYFTSSNGEGLESIKLMHQVVHSYLSDWYKFVVVENLDGQSMPDIAVVAQSDFAELAANIPTTARTMIVVVCTNTSWKLERDGIPGARNVEAISYPFGPYKLAKVIRICLDKLDTSDATNPPLQEFTTTVSEREAREEVSEVMQAVDKLNLGPDVRVVQQGQILSNEEFAPMMMEAMSSQSSRSIEQDSGFPFPTIADTTASTMTTPQPPTTSNSSVSVPSTPNAPFPLEAGLVPGPGPGLVGPVGPAAAAPRTPRLLLVDDNKVNLGLLRAFMQKRGYTEIHSAEDGAASVATFEALLARDPPAPVDIVFMDISMPVMNGFEAARRIREAEARFRNAVTPLAGNSSDTAGPPRPPPPAPPPPAMIIALTGLASARDQSEAFTSGFDLYLVKPISFKSVAKLLDSWERNGGAATAAPGMVMGADIGAE